MMMIVNKNIADLRKDPDTKSERVSQALFNTDCKIIEESGDWSLIETPDGYRGYIKSNHLSEPIPGEGRVWKVNDLFAPILSSFDAELVTKLAFDTRFQGVEGGEHIRFNYPTAGVVKVNKAYLEPSEKVYRLSKIEKLGPRFIGTPYLWGGISPFGIDCSGFVQRIFHYLGTTLPRDSSQQVELGEEVEYDQLKLGDLLFFPGHVGISLGGYRMIHSCGYANGVTITDLEDNSDYSLSLKKKFRVAKRVSLRTDVASR